MNKIILKNISKSYPSIYGSNKKVFDSINLVIENNKFTTLFSSFGSGKSTLLKIISAVEKNDSGELLLNDTNYSKPSNKIVFIPGEPTSFPWLSVVENIKFVNPEVDVKNIIKLTGLEGYENYYPSNESIGFRFRISLAKALTVNPKFILLDEPFTKLDVETKFEIYDTLLNIFNETDINFILATTNINEAIILSNQIIIIKNSGSSFEKFPIEMERNSTLDILESETFQKLKNSLIDK